VVLLVAEVGRSAECGRVCSGNRRVPGCAGGAEAHNAGPVAPDHPRDRPEAEQGISYGVPAFKVRGKTIAGFAAFKDHLSYLPHSGSVFPQLKEELKGYTTSSGALRFAIDQPIPVPLVEKLIAVRLQQAFPA
jgi:hypothetical protein